MQGIYGAAAAANALAAQSNMLGTPFGTPHPASMVDRTFPGPTNSNPFAPRASPPSPLTPQHFAMLRSQLAGESSRIETSEELQKQLQHSMGFPRFFPPFPNYQQPFPTNLPPISYYMPNTLDRQLDKQAESPQRPNSHTPSSSDRSSGVSPLREASPQTKPTSPTESRKSGNKSPEKRILEVPTTFPSFSMPTNPFSIGNSLHQTAPGFLPSLVASGSIFRPYCFQSGLGQGGPHGLVRQPSHVNGSPIIGPLNISPRVPLSPTCLRR